MAMLHASNAWQVNDYVEAIPCHCETMWCAPGLGWISTQTQLGTVSEW